MRQGGNTPYTETKSEIRELSGADLELAKLSLEQHREQNMEATGNAKICTQVCVSLCIHLLCILTI